MIVDNSQTLAGHREREADVIMGGLWGEIWGGLWCRINSCEQAKARSSAVACPRAHADGDRLSHGPSQPRGFDLGRGAFGESIWTKKKPMCGQDSGGVAHRPKNGAKRGVRGGPALLALG